jgi:glycosyltransferase involved in cell wall biosynthesis
MQPIAAVGHTSLATLSGLRVLALLEATRVTGVARNVLEYAALASAGAGGVSVAMTLALIRRGADARFRSDLLRQQATATKIPFEVLIERHRYDRDVLVGLQRLFEAHRPAIIETHHVKSHCLVALSGLWRRCPWIAFHHGYTETDLKVRAYNHVDRWSLRRAAHVVTTNESFAAMLADRGVDADRITVLHNGVREWPGDPLGAAALRRKAGLGDCERVVLAVGRLSHEKGHAHLIRAAVAWKDKARVMIVGDGPERARLESQVRDLGLAGRVVFAGTTANVAPFYALADVFVLPSLSEGSPNAMLEAMASGVPVVATRVGGVPEIAVDGVTALLGAARDPLFLARAVNTLLDDRALATRLACAARHTVSTHFTPEQRAWRLSRVYAAVGGAPVSRSGVGQYDDGGRLGAACR